MEANPRLRRHGRTRRPAMPPTPVFATLVRWVGTSLSARAPPCSGADRTSGALFPPAERSIRAVKYPVGGRRRYHRALPRALLGRPGETPLLAAKGREI